MGNATNKNITSIDEAAGLEEIQRELDGINATMSNATSNKTTAIDDSEDAELEERRKELQPKLRELGREARGLRVEWKREKDVMADPKVQWTPHLSALLAGLNDSESPLSLLEGHETTVLRHIYSFSFEYLYENWRNVVCAGLKPYVRNTLPANLKGSNTYIPKRMALRLQATCDDQLSLGYTVGDVVQCQLADSSCACAFTKCGNVTFPTPTGVDVNMMPFVMGDKTSLPEELQVYYEPLIAQCPVRIDEIGKVCYLSITERYIEKGDTQRRGGLHIEAPLNECAMWPGRLIRSRWGRGRNEPDGFIGGIYMASNVNKSCAIWDALVDKSITDLHGGMEHLRPLLNAPYLIPANELIWMTDRTPHQAMPQPESGYRQFFRLVTSDFNVWHSQPCTPNPKVPLPEHVIVITESRFDNPKKASCDGAKELGSLKINQSEDEGKDRKPAARP